MHNRGLKHHSFLIPFAADSDTPGAGVQYILDTVVTELLADDRRRFIYVEVAFLYRWWREQDEDRQDKVKQLVNEGNDIATMLISGI